MLASDIINDARRWTYTTSDQYSDVNALHDLNIVYRELIATINQDVNEDLFADFFTTNAVKWQSEYSKPLSSNSGNGLGNMLGVSVNYSPVTARTGTASVNAGSNTITGIGTLFTQEFRAGDAILMGSETLSIFSIDSDTTLTLLTIPASTHSGVAISSQSQDWRKLRSSRFSNLDRDQEWYRINQPQTDPFYIMYGSWVFIYPVPPQNAQNSVRIYCTLDVKDLASGDTPIIDDNWHYVLAVALKKYIFKSKGMQNEAADATNEFEIEKRKMINTISDTQLMPFVRENLDCSQFYGQSGTGSNNPLFF